MATISPNDHAPSETVHYSFAGAEFDLEPGGTFETNDPDALENAAAHPWLKVERPVEVAEGGFYGDEHLAAKDDPLSRFNSVANDPDAVRKALEERFGSEAGVKPLAVDAELDQDKEHFAGKGDRKVAETLAAHDKQEEREATHERSRAVDKQQKAADKQTNDVKDEN
jgi:hypothetical protein